MFKKILLAASLIFGAFTPFLALARMMDWDGDGRYMDGFFGGGWLGWGMMIFGWIFWVLLIIGIVYLIKHLIGGCGWKETQKGGSAAEILKERYAKGEINKEEFEGMMKDINK